MASPRLAAQITESFYAWEVRGRGWDIAPYRVSLEPPFRYCQILPEYERPLGAIDDGHRPTFLSALVESIRSAFSTGPPRAEDEREPFEELPPHEAPPPGERSTFRLLPARDQASSSEVASFLVKALATARQPVSLELVGRAGEVGLQVSCDRSDEAHVLGSLEGYLPDVSVSQNDDLLEGLQDDRLASFVVDFGLSDEFFLPLQTFSSFRVDPYIALVAGLSQAGLEEWIALQVLFTRAENPWSKALRLALTSDDGGCIFADAPDFLPLSREKAKAPMFAVLVRVCARAGSADQARELAQGTAAFVRQFARPGSNELLPLENDGYPDSLHAKAVGERSTYRTGMLLSADELVGLVHLPDASVRHPSLLREGARTKAAPQEFVGHPYILGENVHRGRRTTVSLDLARRLQHIHVLGATGTGKSTLLLELILQDIRSGIGCAVLDPHGDLIDDVLARLPDERINETVVFDPADEEYPVGMNVLSAKTNLERELLSVDLVSVFQRLSTSWGDTMGAVLSNAILAILEHERGGTLLDLRHFLLDESFRTDYLRGVADEEVRFFWTKGYPLIGTRSIGPILTRLDVFLRPKVIRHIVGQRVPKLDLGAVMSEGKVFLARLSQGLIGETNAALLGSLLATRFHQLALARQQVLKGERRPFFLYADEAQHYVTPSMAALLTDVRKYAFGLVLSHQSLSQVRGTPIEGSLGNAFTRIAFRVGDDDSKRLAEGCSFFEAADFRRLSLGQCLVRLGSAEHDCNLETPALEPIDAITADERRRKVLQASRERFGTPIAEVLRDLAPGPAPAEAATAPPTSPVESGDTIVEDPVGAPSSTLTPPPSRDHPTARGKVSVPSPGRGGPEHKYLQHLIKRLAEERGFRAVIEAVAGAGQADVALYRDDRSIACEVSVTTDADHELANVEKCLAAGFTQVVLVAATPAAAVKHRKSVGGQSFTKPVVVLEPGELVEYLDSFQSGPSESTVRGYKVRINRQGLSPEDAAERRKRIAKTIARSWGKTDGK